MIPLGRQAGDTIADRKWRIVLNDDGTRTLECEAMAPSGWKAITTRSTMLEIRRFAAWLGLTVSEAHFDACMKFIIPQVAPASK